MWISKKRWRTLEKRVADLERKVQDQLIKEKAVMEKLLTLRQKLTESSPRHWKE